MSAGACVPSAFLWSATTGDAPEADTGRRHTRFRLRSCLLTTTWGAGPNHSAEASWAKAGAGAAHEEEEGHGNEEDEDCVHKEDLVDVEAAGRKASGELVGVLGQVGQKMLVATNSEFSVLARAVPPGAKRALGCKGAVPTSDKWSNGPSRFGGAAGGGETASTRCCLCGVGLVASGRAWPASAGSDAPDPQRGTVQPCRLCPWSPGHTMHTCQPFSQRPPGRAFVQPTGRL